MKAFLLRGHLKIPCIWCLRVWQAAAQANEQARLTEMAEALRLICRIFYSLNWLDIPEYFEDNLAIWMDAFHQYVAC